MLTTDLGACEWFVWDLRRSNLIDRGQLDQVIGEFLNKNPGAEPPALAEYLVGKGVLTEFQADRLLQGKTQGFVLGPFTLMDSLGTGSMGTVYKAQSKNDGKWYAVKVLPRRSMWNVRIARRKVRLFEQCQHAAVVPFIDVGTSGGMHYLAWPLVEGETLDKLVERQGKMNVAQACQFAIHVCEGLELCHKQNLFHGLLKPSNLMLSPEGQIRILDFGIGCLLAETEGESLVDTMSTANSVNSGLDCASPESIMDPTNLTPVGDQYSLGCVLYHFLTGRYPFPDGTAVEKMMCHQHKQPQPIQELNSEVPSDLVAVIEKLMQKAPADRYADCSEVMEVLRPFTGSSAGPARRAAPTLQRLKPLRPEGARPPEAASEPAPAPDAAPREPDRTHPRPLQPLRPKAKSGVAKVLRPAAPPPVQPEAAPVEITAPDPSGAPVPPSSLAQRLGTLGVVLLAVISGIAAWLVSSLINFKF